MRSLGQPGRPIERDPAHGLRLGEVLRLHPDLPDSRVGVAPVIGDEVGQIGEVTDRVAVEAVAPSRVPEGGVEQLAERVELELAGGGVADAHGT